MEMMSQVEEKTLLTSLMSFDFFTEIPEGGGGGGERRARRRRRRKARADVDGEAKKRRLSDEQVRFLETCFGKERKLESARKVHLAAELGLDPKQVAVWFQNRRARWKNKQMEEEFNRLKSAHDAAVVHKCHLENEVLKLQGKLSEAEEEIRKLSEGLSGVASGGERGGNTPSSSLSTENHQPLLGELGVEDLMYIHEYNYNNFLMEWVNMYGI